MPSVAMKEGKPIFAMSTPLIRPTMTPAASPAATAIHPSRYSLNSTAKTNPEKPMTAGKERSISPAPMMKVRPTASSISGGNVERKVV